MPRFLTTLPLIAALALGTSLQAQETATTEPAAEEPAQTETTQTEEKPAGPTDLDMGQEVTQDPTYFKETHGDWRLKCFRAEGQDDPCEMYQLLREEAGNPVAEFSLFILPEGAQAAAGATIVVPLETLLTEKLKISIDNGPVKSFAYSFCSTIGCFARIGLTANDVAAFKNGGAANLQLVPFGAPEQKINVKMSLTGFTAAYNALEEMKK